MVCAGSVRLIERLTEAGVIPERSSSGAAAEGTCAHTVREECLDLGLDPFDYVGQTLRADGYETLWTNEFAAYLQPGIDWINEQSGEVIVEHHVDLNRWMPGQFGTLDTAIIQRAERRLIVNDLKFGAGVDVAAEGNRQLRIYAIGVLDNFDLWDAVDTIDIVIDQPRCGGTKTATVSVLDLEAFAHEVHFAARAVDDPDAPLVVSTKGCHFCPVKDTEQGCPAYTNWMLSLIDEHEDDDAIITPERRWEIVSNAHLVTKWLAKLHADSVSAAEAGQPDPGSKLVYGQRGNRKYTNEARAERVLTISLGEQAFTRKVKSPAQAEKDLAPGKKKVGHAKAWRILNRLITQDDGRPILVPVADPRSAIPSLTASLDDLDDL